MYIYREREGERGVVHHASSLRNVLTNRSLSLSLSPLSPLSLSVSPLSPLSISPSLSLSLLSQSPLSLSLSPLSLFSSLSPPLISLSLSLLVSLYLSDREGRNGKRRLAIFIMSLANSRTI